MNIQSLIATGTIAIVSLTSLPVALSETINRGSSSNGTGSYAKAESLAGRAFQNRFFDVLWQTLLYQLNGALIGTEI
jgi:hypothetical protein